MADYYAARAETIPPLPWSNSAPSLSVIAVDPNAGNLASQRSASRRSLLHSIDTEMLIGQLSRQFQPAAAAYLGRGPEPAPQPPGYVEVISTAIDVMIDQIRRSRLAGDSPNVMVDLDLSHLNVLAFYEAETAIERARPR